MWDWDETKRRQNLAKHGVDFAEVEHFEWDSASGSSRTCGVDYGEVRWRARGLIGTRLHILVYTERDGRNRLISLRKANGQRGGAMAYMKDPRTGKEGPCSHARGGRGNRLRHALSDPDNPPLTDEELVGCAPMPNSPTSSPP